MRILHVVNDANPGGAQTLIEALASRTVRTDETHVLVLLGRGGLSDRLEAVADSVEYVGMDQRSVVPIKAMSHLLRLVRTRRIDLVHSHLHQSDLINALTPHRRPRVSTQHTSQDASTSAVAKAAWRAAGAVSIRMDQIVACSPSARGISEHFNYSYSPDRMLVIYNGTAVTEAATPDPGGNLLLHLGRYSPPKDHRNLFEAMAIVHKSHPDARLRCAGTGMEETNEQLITWRRDLGLEGVVELLGPVSDVRGQIREAQAFVLSSYNEALPMAALESISEGLPVITTMAGDCQVTTVDEHLVAPVRDPEALAQSILWFLEQPGSTRQQLRQASWELSHQRFDIDRTVERYRDLYRDLITS